MSKRSIRDYVNRAFFARDKATLAAVADEAEEAFQGAPDEKEHEGGDEEGDDKDHSGHVGGVHVHIEHPGKGEANDKSADARFKKIEDSIAALGKTVGRVADAVGVKVADAEDEQSPEERLANLRKARAGQGQGGASEGEGDKDDDEGDGEKKKNPFAKDTDPDSGTTGAAEAAVLQKVEPDLMDADPSLRTGKSDMGDKAYVKKVQDAFAMVVKDAAARAEVLAPGTKVPTIDSATMDAQTAARRLCAFRRGALIAAGKTEKGMKALGKHSTDDVRGMSCDAVRMLFDDASARMWHLNNDSAREVNETAFRPDPNNMRRYRNAQAEKLAEINARNAEFWAKQSGRPN
jgi:hypothetical protein